MIWIPLVYLILIVPGLPTSPSLRILFGGAKGLKGIMSLNLETVLPYTTRPWEESDTPGFTTTKINQGGTLQKPGILLDQKADMVTGLGGIRYPG
jgi:hypothetical protein